MAIIIIEGIDGSGKTTLAERIRELSPVGARIEHHGPLTLGVEQEYVLPIFNVKDDELLIADRWHVGELIYGPIYRGVSLTEGRYNEIIERALDFKHAVKVIVNPPVEIIRERLTARGEDYLKDEHIDEVSAAYEDYARAWDYLLIDDEFEVDETAEFLIALAFGSDVEC